MNKMRNKHILFECGRFLEVKGADDIANGMLESEAAWKLISTCATTVMLEFRRVERPRRRAVPG